MFKCILVKMVVIILLFPMSVNAISAESAILIDSCSGRILFEKNAYAKLPMASTTKIMTGLLACESGLINKSVKVSAFASGTEGSSLWLKIGERLTLENLTYGIMLKSGNDAAVAVAEYLGGSIDAFALLMNKRAEEIGAVNTNFENPHGLDSEQHYTTAYDLALIAREAMKNKKFRKIVSTKTYSIPMEGEKSDRALKNHNKLLWNYEGCNGVKTGYTKKSGRCLVSCAEREGQEFICVTLNASDDWNDHKELLDYGFKNFDKKTISEKGEIAGCYTYDKDKSVELLYGENFYVSVTGTDVITTQIENKELKLPAEKGTVAAVLNVYCNGEKLTDIPLVTSEKVSERSFFDKVINFIFGLFKK